MTNTNNFDPEIKILTNPHNRRKRGQKRLTQEEFQERCRRGAHPNLDYSQSTYVKNNVKVKVSCKVHPGDFYWIMPYNLIRGKNPCTKCKKEWHQRWTKLMHSKPRKALKYKHNDGFINSRVFVEKYGIGQAIIQGIDPMRKDYTRELGLTVDSIPYQRSGGNLKPYVIFRAPSEGHYVGTAHRWQPKDSDSVLFAYGEYRDYAHAALLRMLASRVHIGSIAGGHRRWEDFKIFDFTGDMEHLDKVCANAADKYQQQQWLYVYERFDYSQERNGVRHLLELLNAYMNDVIAYTNKQNVVTLAHLIPIICVLNLSNQQLNEIFNNEHTFQLFVRVVKFGWMAGLKAFVFVEHFDKRLYEAPLRIDMGFYLGESNQAQIADLTGKPMRDFRRQFIDLDEEIIGVRESEYLDELRPVLPPFKVVSNDMQRQQQATLDEEEMFMQYLASLSE